MKNQKFTTDPHHFRVAIFGSARIEMNDPLYNQIQNLAKMIAKEGMDVVTGGGPGLMEAANAGHFEGRQDQAIHSYGLPIKLPSEQLPNKHLDIERDFEKFSDRLDHFMTLANIVVVASGGIGTLLELMYTWQLQQVEQICHMPIVLMGDMWGPFIKWIEEWPLEKGLISQSDLDLIFLAKDVEETMDIIKKAHQEFLEKGPEYCWSFERYK